MISRKLFVHLLNVTGIDITCRAIIRLFSRHHLRPISKVVSYLLSPTMKKQQITLPSVYLTYLSITLGTLGTGKVTVTVRHQPRAFNAFG